MKTAEVLSSFLSNVVKKLQVPQYPNFDPIVQNIEDAICYSEIQKPSKYSYHSEEI